MKEYALHPQTKQRLEAFLLAPSHGLMLLGPKGLGKKTLAVNLAESLLGVSELASYPYGLIISSEDKPSISIEAIRSLEKFLKLKTTSRSELNRVAIIDNAHLLTLEAQNALLKTLEAPPNGTLIILTAADEQALLPTIRSRVQAIQVNKPAKDDLRALFSDHKDKDFEQAYAISGGAPALMYSLLGEDKPPLMEATVVARQLLSQSTYDRLLSVDQLSRQSALVQDTIYILQQMATLGLRNSSEDSVLRRWERVLAASYRASEALSKNTQTKLTLTDLMLGL